jgi:alkylhydroperoxidase family enzyme
LAAQGRVLRLWRTVDGAHTIGVWRAEDESVLHAGVLASLPLRQWMTVQATHLVPHPNDPGRHVSDIDDSDPKESMRLQPIPPASLTPEQLELYADIAALIDSSFGDLVARRRNGALIGPFNGWLHHPQFGAHAWALNKALWIHTVLPAHIHQLVILVVAARFGARYEIYGHEYFARRAGLADEKIAAIVAGERPHDLTDDERVAYDMATSLSRGGVLPESTYRAVQKRLGDNGVAEIVFLVGCFAMVAVTLNAFDSSIPGHEERCE